MTTTTLAILRANAADRADMPTPSTTTFIPTATWTKYVNASCAALYDKLIEAYGSDYYVSISSNITTDGTNTRYDLPATFYKLLGVDLQIDSGAGEAGWVSVWRFNMANRNQFALPGLSTYWGRDFVRYRLSGSKIMFEPLPPANQALRLWFAPVFTPLSADGDTFDGINGWEDWVVNDVAMKALVKEESDISGVQALQDVLNARLASIVSERDAAAPASTVDVYAANGWGWGFGWGGILGGGGLGGAP